MANDVRYSASTMRGIRGDEIGAFDISSGRPIFTGQLFFVNLGNDEAIHIQGIIPASGWFQSQSLPKLGTWASTLLLPKGNGRGQAKYYTQRIEEDGLTAVSVCQKILPCIV